MTNRAMREAWVRVCSGHVQHALRGQCHDGERSSFEDEHRGVAWQAVRPATVDGGL